MKGAAGVATGGAVLTRGIVAGTRIATARGWRPVEALRPGDAVLTLSAGLQPLNEARPARMAARPLPPSLWPLSVPRGALDNREPLILPPDQRLLIGMEEAGSWQDDPFALVPAAALEGWRGIARMPPLPGLRLMTLGFAAPQLVYASRAVMLSCAGATGEAVPGNLLCLTPEEAREVVACLIAVDLGRYLRQRAG